MERIAQCLTAAMVVMGPGCGPAAVLQPNGNHHVLQFVTWDSQGNETLGEGLGRDIFLPRDYLMVAGCGKLSLSCNAAHFVYDFEGTALVTQPSPGLRVIEAPLEDAGYRIRVVCDQEPDGGLTQLSVSVMADGGTRYADVSNIGCRRAAGLRLTPEHDLYAVGAAAFAHGALWLSPDGGQRYLGGMGWTVDDGGSLAFAEPWFYDTDGTARLTFFALAPGPSGRVHAGTTSADLPVQVLPDSAWALSLDARPCSYGGDGGLESLETTLVGTAWDGGAVGLPDQGTCDYLFSNDAGQRLPSTQWCGTCVHATGAGQLCVSLRGKTACVQVDAKGNRL